MLDVLGVSLTVFSQHADATRGISYSQGIRIIPRKLRVSFDERGLKSLLVFEKDFDVEWLFPPSLPREFAAP